MPQTRCGLPLPVRLICAKSHAAMPVKLCCPLRMASRSGYVKPKGVSPGLLRVSDTTSLGRASPGTGFSNAELIQLKIVVFAPIPRASVRTAIAAKPGLFLITRNPYLQSCNRFDICVSVQLRAAQLKLHGLKGGADRARRVEHPHPA